MNQINIISDLIKWIEKNLEQPLSIDNVAKKSGYSKWHLQRMFKEVSGQVLGTYIRHRRLTHAALALRMTSKPILDIAMQYRFDSQQTFTRSFKKQFSLTPASYRRAEYWNTVGLTPAINLHQTPLELPEPNFLRLPKATFGGVTYKNNCALSAMLQEQFMLREQFFLNYFSNFVKTNKFVPQKLYTFSHSQCSKENPDDQESFYTIALDKEFKMDQVEKFIAEEGLYLSFRFNGSPDDFDNFVLQIYLAAIPALNVKRRPGSDIEIHYNNSNMTVESILESKPTHIECDYCVPIITASEWQQA